MPVSRMRRLSPKRGCRLCPVSPTKTTPQAGNGAKAAHRALQPQRQANKRMHSQVYSQTESTEMAALQVCHRPAQLTYTQLTDTQLTYTQLTYPEASEAASQTLSAHDNVSSPCSGPESRRNRIHVQNISGSAWFRVVIISCRLTRRILHSRARLFVTAAGGYGTSSSSHFSTTSQSCPLLNLRRSTILTP